MAWSSHSKETLNLDLTILLNEITHLIIGNSEKTERRLSLYMFKSYVLLHILSQGASWFYITKGSPYKRYKCFTLYFMCLCVYVWRSYTCQCVLCKLLIPKLYNTFWHLFIILDWNIKKIKCSLGFPDGSGGKQSTCNAGYLGSIPGLGRSPGDPLQYSCLEHSMDCIVHGVTESGMTERLSLSSVLWSLIKTILETCL